LLKSKSSKPTGSSRAKPFGKTQGKPTSMEELLASSGYQIPSIRRGQEVSGKIVSISHSEILVDIGAKSEGIVASREMSSIRDIISGLSVGDTIDVTVIYPENDAGQVVLSMRKLSQDVRWQDLEDKKNSDEEIGVVALEVNRGGVICDYTGLRGFLPASLLTKIPSNLADLIGKSLTARVIEVDRQGNRLIFSQKQPDTKDLKAIGKLLAKVKIGQKLAGVVSAILPFGIFVEVNVNGKEGQEGKDGSEGEKLKPSKSSQPSQPSKSSKLEGLVHISEISWEKVEDPSRLFKVGDRVEVMVIAKEEATGRLNLSIKQLAHDPFLEASAAFSKDEEVTGSVARVTPYGVFMTLKNGVEGFVPISKISPNENYQIGQKITCTIESIDSKARRISLSPLVREKPILYR